MRSFNDMTMRILWQPILKFCLQFAFVATKFRNAQTTIPQSPVDAWGFVPSNQHRPCERTDHMLHANNQFVRISLVVRALYLRQRITTKRLQQMVALDPSRIAGQTPWRRRHLRKMAFVNGRGDGAVLVYCTLYYIFLSNTPMWRWNALKREPHTITSNGCSSADKIITSRRADRTYSGSRISWRTGHVSSQCPVVCIVVPGRNH